MKGIELAKRIEENEETMKGIKVSIETLLEYLSTSKRHSITQFDQEKLNDHIFLANLFGRFIVHDTQPKCHIQQQSKCIATIPRAHPNNLIKTMAYHSFYNYLITGSTNCELKLWDCETKLCKMTITGHTDVVNCVLVSQNDDRYFFSASDDMSIKYYSIENGHCVKSIDNAHSSHVLSLLDTSDGRLVSCSSDTRIKIWSINSWECLKVIQAVSIQCMCLSKSEKQLYTGSSDQSVSLWDLESGSCLKKLTTTGYTNIQSILLLENGQLCLGFDNGLISMWNVDDGQCTKQFNSKPHTSRVTQFLMNDTGQFISCSHDQTIKVWSLESGECVTTLEGHDSAVLCMTVMKDGILTSGSIGEHSIKFWQ
jgi:WD40 repeat protein